MNYYLIGDKSRIRFKVSYDHYYKAVQLFGIFYYDEFYKGYVCEVPNMYICRNFIMKKEKDYD